MMQYWLPYKTLSVRYMYNSFQCLSVRILLYAVTCIAASHSIAQTTQTFTSSGSFTPAAGVPSLNVGCWGGGGGGGNAAHSGTGTSRGGGGAGGAYAKKIFSSPSGSYTVIVGAGGNGGNAGTDSWFGCSCSLIAKGGAAGGNGSKSNGAGGAGTATGSTGDAGAVFAGGSGAAASLLGTGAGGGGAGSGGAGSSASLTIINGAATASNGGAGAAGFLLGLGVADGNNGNNYGGGGGGATCITLITGSSATGGNGGAGLVTVTYTCPGYSLSATNNTAACAGNSATVSISGTAASLPAGTYTITYNLTGSNTASGNTATMTVATAGTGSFTTATLTNGGSTNITITSLSSGSGVGCSSTISSNNTAVITVNTAPYITVQPLAPAVICSGSGTQTISVSATGSGLSYSWRRNGVAVSNGGVFSGQGTASLTLTNTTAGETGTYDVIISGNCSPAVTSNSVSVTVNAATVITAGAVPGSQIKLLNAAAAALSITATGTAISYQWYSNTSNSNSGGSSLGAANGAQTSIYTPSTAVESTLYYYCVVSGTCAVQNSSTAAVIATNTDTWLGGGTDSWNTGANWNTGSVPGASNDVLIPSGNAPYPVLDAVAAATNIDLQNGTTLGLANLTLTLNGAVSGTGTISGSVTASLQLNAAAGTLYFTGSGTGNYLKNFSISTGASASLGNALIIAGGNSLHNEGILTVSGTGVLTTNGFLTIQSNAFGTASIAAGRVAGGYIAGDVTVERYIPANSNKAWRMLASNTSGQTIKEAWQENQLALSNGNPGYGLMISKNFNTLADAQAAGFDTLSPSPSLYKFSTAAGNWVAMTNTSSSLLTAEEGYFVFVRGDRRPGQFIAYTAPVSATTLRSRGSIFQGDQPVKNIAAAKYALLRNPYAAAIDLRQVSIGGGMVDAFQVWDPKLNGTTGNGAYQTLTRFGANYIVTPGAGSYPASGAVWNTIESGSAFIVQASSSAGTVQVLESSKTSGSNDVFRPTGFECRRIIANLYHAANHSLLDGNMILFEDTASNGVDRNDVKKLSNTGENFGLLTEGIELVVERKSNPAAGDTVHFNLRNLKRIDYDMELIADGMDMPGIYCYLEDGYTHTISRLNLSGSTVIHFAVNTDTASFAANRFRLVFAGMGVLPVSFVSVNAACCKGYTNLHWTVAGQGTVGSYMVERSTDGIVINTLGRVTAGNACSYQWQDEHAPAGIVYYRILALAADGHSRYSEWVTVTTGASHSGMTIAPNPVAVNKATHILVPALSAGNCRIVLADASGSTVLNTMLKHTGGTLRYWLQLPSSVAAGVYQLRLYQGNSLLHTRALLLVGKE